MSERIKNIVVTGGTKGIGRAVIEKFAHAGYEILTCARKENDLASLARDISGVYPQSKIYTYCADLSKKDGVISFGDWVLGMVDSVDVLINNAGVFIPGSLLDEAEGNLELMINTNLYSVYHLTRLLMPPMLKTQNSDIFNICSVASLKAYTNGGSYSISKFALYGFSQNLRFELQDKGIRVVSVMPGATLTASWEGVDLPESRFIKASDVAESIWSAHQLSRNTVIEDIVIRPQLGDI